MSKTYYLTTAIAYTSGKPHIGNTYEAILADSIVRFKRQQGYDVRFQTGTDEHGQKIEIKAAEAGVTPKEFVDKTAGVIKEIWDQMTHHTTDLLEQLILTMKNRFRRFLRNYMIRVIFTRVTMKVCTVHLANHFLQNHS